MIQNNLNWEKVITVFLLKKRSESLVTKTKESLDIAEKTYRANGILIKDVDDAFKISASNAASYLRKCRKIIALDQTHVFLKPPSKPKPKQKYYASAMEMKKSFINNLLENRKKFQKNIFFTFTKNNIAKVKFSTHVSKLTHSSTKATSFIDSIQDVNPKYLTTSLCGSLKKDSVGPAQFAPITQLLELKNGSETFLDALLNRNALLDFLEPTLAHSLYTSILNDITSSTDIRSDQLSKQVYFPIDKNQETYHLLCPLVSSSLASLIFDSLNSDAQKEARNKRYKKPAGVFYDNTLMTFPGRASLGVTVSNHQNASTLNGKRGGRLILFNAEPPVFEKQLKITAKSIFYDNYFKNFGSSDLEQIKKLLMLSEKIGINFKEPKRKEKIVNLLVNLIDDFLELSSRFYELESGWSTTTLDINHRCLLDPTCHESIVHKNAHDWKNVLSRDFANHLSFRLAGHKKDFTATKDHHRLFSTVFEKKLRTFETEMTLLTWSKP